MELTHASFFSGVGGLDMGLERAGWRTVSFSEIDPYASAVLAQRWPDVPNLGDIVQVAARPDDASANGRHHGTAVSQSDDWRTATLWSGGFPCQDLSVAGKRRGMGTHGERADTRSGLAYAFLDLVERHRPPAILLENVPGLLSSNRGRDFHALQRRLAELGYVGAFRVLDAQHFGVPQRRRRVFIVALDARRGLGADSAAEVLSVGSRCAGHPATGIEAGPGAAERARGGVAEPGFYNATARFGEWAEGDTAGNLSARDWKSANHLVGSPPDARGVRAPDGLAGWLDDRDGVAKSLLSKANSSHAEDLDTYVVAGESAQDSDSLPLGLDSHRYRCAGNGVVSSVSEWIGLRLASMLA